MRGGRARENLEVERGDDLRELHGRFEAYCRRSLYDVKLVVLFLDAIYLPVRPSGPKEGVICAWDITETGAESWFRCGWGARVKEDSVELGRDLIIRASPPHGWSWPTGRPADSAVEEIWPRADRQHCAVHYADPLVMPTWVERSLQERDRSL